MTDDMALLREFARSRSEEAFATLVSHHINLVYSVALREVRDAHVAHELTQAVFSLLAQKADSLNPKTILSGWLWRTTRNASSVALRTQRRREHREQHAYMRLIIVPKGHLTLAQRFSVGLRRGSVDKSRRDGRNPHPFPAVPDTKLSMRLNPTLKHWAIVSLLERRPQLSPL